MTKLELFDRKVQKAFNSPIAGAGAHRVMVDNKFVAKMGLQPDGRGREDSLLWCVKFGVMGVPRNEFSYGVTLSDALKQAEKDLAKLIKERTE